MLWLHAYLYRWGLLAACLLSVAGCAVERGGAPDSTEGSGGNPDSAEVGDEEGRPSDAPRSTDTRAHDFDSDAAVRANRPPHEPPQEPPDESQENDPPSLPMRDLWVPEPIGFGVTYMGIEGIDLTKVAVVYGGYSASDAHSLSWSSELARAWLVANGFAHLYSVRGPATAWYSGLEIGNSKIVQSLEDLSAMEGPLDVWVIAHSSGGFVANEFFGQVLRSRSSGTLLVQMTYFNLDGARLRVEIEALRAYCPVLAIRGDLRSENAAVADAEGLRSIQAGRGRSLVVDASSSNCQARWCLHDALITSEPHNPHGLNVALDYTDWNGRSVVTDYLEQGCLP